MLKHFDPTKTTTFNLVSGFTPIAPGGGSITFLLEGQGGRYIAEQIVGPSVTSFVVPANSVNFGEQVFAYIAFQDSQGYSAFEQVTGANIGTADLVPEPGGLALGGFGLAGLIALRRRRGQAATI